MALEMENLRGENSAQTGWLAPSPAQALMHLVWDSMIHTCMADREGRELGVKPSHLTYERRPRGGRDKIVPGFISPFELTLLKLWK